MHASVHVTVYMLHEDLDRPSSWRRIKCSCDCVHAAWGSGQTQQLKTDQVFPVYLWIVQLKPVCGRNTQRQCSVNGEINGADRAGGEKALEDKWGWCIIFQDCLNSIRAARLSHMMNQFVWMMLQLLITKLPSVTNQSWVYISLTTCSLLSVLYSLKGIVRAEIQNMSSFTPLFKYILSLNNLYFQKYMVKIILHLPKMYIKHGQKYIS